MEMSGQLHTPADLTPGKDPQVLIGRGCWMGQRIDKNVVKKKLFALAGNRTPAVMAVASLFAD
jgi:hypothetical protein